MLEVWDNLLCQKLCWFRTYILDFNNERIANFTVVRFAVPVAYLVIDRVRSLFSWINCERIDAVCTSLIGEEGRIERVAELVCEFDLNWTTVYRSVFSDQIVDIPRQFLGVTSKTEKCEIWEWAW